MRFRHLPMTAALALTALSMSRAAESGPVEYRVLATSRTSTMEKEMNQAAADGFRFHTAMGGETTAGNEVVVVMSKPASAPKEGAAAYKLLATSKTSTMQREIQALGDAGFDYKGQTVFETAFGGEEVVVIMERPPDSEPSKIQYLLLATTKTSTMQRELAGAGASGFTLVGFTVSKTAFGGAELVSIMKK